MSTEQPVVEMRGLTKVFKDFWMRPRVTAVDALDMAVYPNEVFGLLGPNGSGKSTTIKIILGLLFPTKGRVSVFGKMPTDVKIKHHIGFLPEESYLYRFLNARETLDYYGRLFGLPRHQRQKRIDELLSWVGLDAVQRRPVGEYSKGMQRRIGLAQALINAPKLLILDEPTSGLDPLGTRQIKDLIVRLKEKGTTVILSSHLMADVEDVCDRVSILYGGKIRAEGTVDELLRVTGTTLLETDELKDETITKIEQLIEAEEGKGIRRREAPRQKLETLFLEIVHKAQAEGVATGGALTGGAFAEFLSDESQAQPAEQSGEQLIEHLVEGDPAPEPVAASEAQARPETVAAKAQQSVIDELTVPEPPASPQVTPTPATPNQDEKTDQSVIDELLGDKDNP